MRRLPNGSIQQESSTNKLSGYEIQKLRNPRTACVCRRLGCMGMSHAYGAPADRREMTGLVAFSPLANGLLSDRYTPASCFDAETDYRATMPQFRSESYERNRELLELIRRIAEDKNATPAQISLAWMLCKKPWIVPIPGTRKADRLKENAEATDVMLTDEEVEAIDRALDVMPMSDVFGGTKPNAQKQQTLTK